MARYTRLVLEGLRSDTEPYKEVVEALLFLRDDDIDEKIAKWT